MVHAACHGINIKQSDAQSGLSGLPGMTLKGRRMVSGRRSASSACGVSGRHGSTAYPDYCHLKFRRWPDNQLTFPVNDCKPVGGDVVVPEDIHRGDVRHRRDDEVLAGREGLSNPSGTHAAA